MLSPFAQTDPASMAIWVNCTPTADVGLNQLINSAIDAALVHDGERLHQQIAESSDPATVARVENTAAAIWHEKRHFLDLLLTNYGSFRRRQFASVQVNLLGLLAQLERVGMEKIWFPLTVYSDETAVFRLGLGSPPSDLIRQARDIRNREAMLAEDAGVGEGPYGRFRAGGDAQMEAIAFLCEGSAFTHEFGADNWSSRYTMHPNSRIGRLYNWIVPVFKGFGLGSQIISRLDGEGVFLDATVALPVLFAALSGRYWGDASAGGKGMMPLPRLVALLQRLSQQKAHLTEVGEVWKRVNCVSTELWNRSVLDEIKADITQEDKWLEQIQKETDCSPWLYEQLSGTHTTRLRLFELLKETPEIILDGRAYHADLAERLAPPVIKTWPRGYVGNIPSDWRPLWARKGSHPDVLLCWAIYRIVKSKNVKAEDVFSATSNSQEDWENFARFEAPASKLALKGRKHRVMLPLKFEGASASVPMEVAVDPLFASPDPISDATEYYESIGLREHPCDRCSARIGPEIATIAPTWWIRKQHRMQQWLSAVIQPFEIEALLISDWSDWILCKRCFGELG